MKIERPSGQGAQAPVVTASRALSSQREPAPTPRVASRRAVEGADEAREAHGRITLLERARREADSLATLYQDLRDVVDDALNQSEPGTSKFSGM